MTDPHPPGLVAVPHLDTMYCKAAWSIFGVLHRLPAGSGFSTLGDSHQVDVKRNRFVREMLGKDRLRWLMFLDSDMTFQPDTVRLLLCRDVDVVGGLYVKKGEPHHPLAGTAETAADGPERRPTDCEGFRWAPLTEGDVGPNGLADVDVLGTGCMLIRRPVLEAMEDPWFALNREHNRGQNEDFNFCLRARRAGFRVACDTTVRPGHIAARPVTLEGD